MKLDLVRASIVLIVGMTVTSAACGGGAAQQPTPLQNTAPAPAPADVTEPPAPTAVAPIDGVIAKLRDYKDQVCACRDEACFTAVQQDMQTWSEGVSGDAELRASQPNDQQQAELNLITKHLGECAAKVLSKP
ncbi:MAG: hypothetical protein AB7P03_10110 [Kofleriaceae bacterium]